jgi:hypothetical protein
VASSETPSFWGIHIGAEISYSRIKRYFNDDEICMTAKEVIEIIKESNLWPLLAGKERQEGINHVLKINQPSTEADIEDVVGEVYTGS